MNAVNRRGKPSCEDPPPGELIVVQCYAGQSMAYMKVLIDHGSQSSAITESALERSGESKKLRSTNVRLTSAQGSTFEVKGRVGLDLQIGKVDYECDLVVTPILLPGVDVILGNDFFSKYRTKLFTYPDKEPLFILENKIVPLVKVNIEDKDLIDYQVFNIAQEDDEILGVVKTIKPVFIPPREEGFIKVKLPSTINKYKNDKLLFSPIELQFCEELGMLEGVIRPHTTNKDVNYGFIRYRNYSAYPYELPKHFVLGELYAYDTLNHEDDVRMLEGNFINAIKSSEDRWNEIKDQLLEKVRNAEPDVHERLLRVFKKHQKSVNLEGEVLGTTDTVTHKIDYFGPENNYVPPYPTPKSEREELSQEVQKLMKTKKIEESLSSHNSPVLPIRKKNGELRLVFDFRRINTYTSKQKFPLPRIDDILNELYGGKVFSCLDMKSGYSQVKLHPDSRPLTAFTVPEGRYQHVVLPQGLTNAPSCFQSLMCNVVSGLAPHIFCFLDDLLIVSDSYEQHEKHLDMILGRLEKHKLSIRIDKCEFFKENVNYLGFKVGREGIAPLPQKIDAIKNYPRPLDLYQLRSFLGLTSYYRRFLDNYAEISTPLVALTKGHPKKGKRVKIEWNDEAEKAFNTFKERMCNDVILKFPNYEKPFRIHTDASQTSIGGVLSQLDDENRDRPICFFSKVLTDTEKRYSTVEREALALVHGLRVQKPIVGSFPIEVISDNAPLIYLMKSSTNNSRVVRWQTAVLDFDVINFRHLAGTKNVPADAMSRKPLDLVDDYLAELPVMAAIRAEEIKEDIQAEINWDIDELKIEQDKDPLYKEIKNIISGKKAEIPRTLGVPLNQFEIQSQVLYFKNVSAYGKDRYQCCIPEKYRLKALQLAHSSPLGGHAGEQHTIQRLMKFSFWPTMRNDAIAFVKNCENCKKYKKSRVPPAPILRSPQVSRPWQCLHVDTVGPLPTSLDGNCYIVTFIDVLTRYGIAVAIPDKRAETIARAMFEKVFTTYGIAETLISDNGTEYVNQLLKCALSYIKIKHRTVTSYRPSANGIVESFNKQLMQILRSQVQDQEALWDRYLNLSVFSYNIGYNRTVRDSPFYLLYGRDAVLPYYQIFQTPSPWYDIDDYRHELANAMHSIFKRAQMFIEQGQLQQETYRNKKAKKRQIEVGDRVYVKKKSGTGKLKEKFVGPFRVEERIGVIFWVRSIATNEKVRVHSERLKLEWELNPSDCNNVHACYPVKINQSEWNEISQETLNVGSSDIQINEGTEEEEWLNKEIPVTYEPTGHRTRSKGPVTEESWVMKRSL